MKTIKNTLSICNTLALLLLFPILGNSQVISKAPEDLIVIGNESINFQSDITNSQYKLYINLPESYDIASKKTYPVYYALDGNRTFDVTTRIYNGIWDDGFVPEMIIVGITYSGSKINPNLNRSRDLTPTNIDRIASSGGASNFLKVLADEIIPFIDSHYRSDGVNRTLAGTSFAGLFTHYTLFTKPTLFKNYIINNPTFWWDNDYSYKLEEEFYKNNKTLNAKVIFLSGEFDAVEKVEQMVEQIEGHNYDNLTLDFRMVENMGHLGGEAEAINQGMRFVYKRPSIKIPEEELKEYCGTYQDDIYVREIVIRDGELSLKREQESNGVKIQVVSKNEFAVLGRYFDFHFNRNEKGEVIGFTRQWDTDPTRLRTYIKIY
ncbi:MAG: alpha/beta hydrolase-fold protein [Bacteroidota bacterium]